MRWIAHRGLVSEHLENSRAAFDFAIAAGFSSFETDLRLTRDNEIVLSHDPDLKRVLQRDLRVNECNRKELEQLRSGKGERLMFIDEIFKDLRQYHWTFDLKLEGAEECLRILAEKVKEVGLLDWIHEHVKFLFWNARHEAEILKYFPKAKMYAMESDCKWVAFGIIFRLPFFNKPKAGKSYGLPPKFMGLSLFDKKYREQYHAFGTKLLAYLPSSKEDAQRAIEAGFDEILTDRSYF